MLIKQRVYVVWTRSCTLHLLTFCLCFSNQRSSFRSRWHWQWDCYPLLGSQSVSLDHSGIFSKSDDLIGQMCSTAVVGHCLLWSQRWLTEVCWSQSQGPTNARRNVSVCVCVCSRHSYQLLNHPSNYCGNRASITPSIIQGRQTERRNAARDVTDEWRDNKGERRWAEGEQVEKKNRKWRELRWEEERRRVEINWEKREKENS